MSSRISQDIEQDCLTKLKRINVEVGGGVEVGVGVGYVGYAG